MGSILKSVGHCVRDQRRKNPWTVTLANRVTSELAGEVVAHELSHAGDFINMGEEALLQERLQYNRHEKRKSSWKLIPAASSWLGSIVAVSYAGLAVEYTDPSPMVKWGVTGLCVSGLALGAYRHLQSRVAQLPNSHKAYVNRPDEQRARTRAGAYWEARIAVPPSAPQLITALLRAKTFQSLTGTKTPQ